MTQKNLNQWLHYLETLHPSEIDMGLSRVLQVSQNMGLLKPAPLVIMAAGTNGKGSTVTLISSILQQANQKVGTYMSPHLHKYNERVKINGVMLTDDDFIESFEAIEKARGEVLLTYFEVGTLSSLYLFMKHKVDVAVLEVGLGGRLDAVNIVDADISVVTSVGLDHQDWLGSDLSAIAFEKAGIYRNGKPAICGEENPQQSLIDHANEIQAPLYIKGEQFSFIEGGSDWRWKGVANDGQEINLKNLPLPSLPIENAATVLQALQFVPFSLSLDNIVAGINNAQLSGRIEQINQPFKAILDVGHNPQAAKLLAQRLNMSPPNGRRFALLAMLADKDPAGVVDELMDYIDEWHLAGIKGYRGQESVLLAKRVESQLPEAICHDQVDNALDDLLVKMNKDDELVVLGSFITVAKAHEWLASLIK
jgi:dihydrofolate synthase/folylpolyglutamate synthase